MNIYPPTYGIRQKNDMQCNIHEHFNTHFKFRNILKIVCVSYITKKHLVFSAFKEIEVR